MNKTTQNSRFSIGKKVASVFLSAAMLVTSFTGLGGVLTTSTPVDAAASDYGLMDNCQDGVILHAWDWSFVNIKNNMKKIAEAGYTSVQTSVIQQAKEATKGKGNDVWWLYYQPANFTIDNTGNSALGTKNEFTEMCQEAHKYGIHVIVDVVANHLGNNTGYDKAASIPSEIRDDSSCWHDLWNQEINYGSRYSITHGSMGGLPDLNTENTKIQELVKAYLRECIDCGADGFRFDAAKHIGVPNDTQNAGGNFWPNVLNEAYNYYKTKGTFSSGLYCYGEILDGTGGPAISEYTQFMSVTDNKTGNDIRGCVAGHNGSGAAASDYKLGAGAAKTVLWAESHDTYSNDSKESTYVSDSDINKTWALVGSRNKATALYFARTGGWRKGNIGAILSTECFNKEVAEVNKFHNYFNGQSEYIACSDNVAYNERGTSGVVLVNCSGGSKQVSVKANKMVAGDYVDQVTGNKFTVDNGQISGQIGNTGIAVVYNAVPIPKPAIVSADPGNTSFTSSTLSVKLGVKNASSGNYTTSEGKSGTYTDGQTITVGSSVSVGGSVTVTLSATGEDGVKKTETFTYVKKDPNEVTAIYFDNSSYKWSNVYAYIYLPSDDPTPSGQILFADALGWGNVNAYFFTGSTAVGDGWPGTQMTSTGTNEYGQKQFKINVPSGATSVVFNSGSAQTVDVTLSGATGYYCTGAQENGKYTVGSWTSTSSSASTTTENAAWPGVKMSLDSSTGYYRIEVPSNLVKGKVIFNDGVKDTTNRYPVGDTTPGLEINDTTMLFSANNSWKPYVVTPDPTTLVNESTLSATTVEKGMPVVISGIASGGKAPYRYSFKYMKSTDSTYIQLGNIFSQKNSETFYPHVAGTFIAQVDIRDANGKIAKKSLKVKVTSSTYDLTNTSKLNKSTIGLGEFFKMSAAKSGGKAPYTYTFMFKRAGNTKWNIIGTEWGTKTSATLTPTAEATFDMRVLIKDGSGRVATKSFQGTVSGKAALANNSTLSAASGVKGSKVTVTGKAIGGTSPYKYAFYYKKSDASSWTTISAYSSTSTATFTPTAAGTYTVKVSIKDSDGTISSKELSYKATSSAALANNSKISATSVSKGTKVTITGAASGGTSPYKYAFYFKRTSNTKWNAIGTEFDTATSANFTPTAAASYDIKVVVKDSANATKEKTFTLTST